MSNTDTTLTIKINKKTRDDAKKVASRLGLPLTTILNSMLLQFVRDQTITISAHPRPLQFKIDEWDRISDEADKGHGITGAFDNLDDLFAHWDQIRAKKTKRVLAKVK